MPGPYCRCERERPYRAPDWEVQPDRGRCRTCRRELQPRNVRRSQAMAWRAIRRHDELEELAM